MGVAAPAWRSPTRTNGERWQALTQSNGRFFLEHVSVGGPYRIDVRAVGFEPAWIDRRLSVAG
jgi:hypothetical protein